MTKPADYSEQWGWREWRNLTIVILFFVIVILNARYCSPHGYDDYYDHGAVDGMDTSNLTDEEKREYDRLMEKMDRD